MSIVYGEFERPLRHLGCTVYALSNAANIAIGAASEIVDETRKRERTGAKSLKVIANAKRHGLSFRKLRMKTRTLERFVREHPTGRYYVRKRGHALAVINGVVYDAVHSSGSVRVVDAWEFLA